ncbi:MAG: CRISPR system precrRNA processing endoribonuclease RAMP protein Cas6 [Chloroflexi bacterium]|nr:CRISPR system precrRNA processing endoribonuclease RAMP protein Cas6 [Chloroflexota bacterium]
MLISLLLTLTPQSPATLPADLGRAVQAETLARLGQVDPGLAEAIHVGDGPKPLTCSGLAGADAAAEPRGRHPADSVLVRPDSRYCVRVTGLVEPVSRALLACLVEQPPATWTLHGQPFRVLDAICDPARDAWTGQTSCEELAAEALRHSDRLSRTVTLEFISPTAFKSQEMQMPVPLPGLVFGSLVERWNAFSSVALDPDLRRFANERVAISRYRLESRPVPTKGGALRIGGVGQVTYTALDDDRYALAALNILADFALYSGVGVQTATGMGQCRRVVQ